MNLRELKDRLSEVLTQAERIRQPYAGKAATMTAEERQRYDGLMDEADNLVADIQVQERELKVRDFAGQVKERMLPLAAAGPARGEGEDAGDAAVKRVTRRQHDAFKGFLRGDTRATEVKANPSGWNEDAIKALAAYEGDVGGFLVVPETFVTELLRKVEDMVYIRQLAGRKFTLDRAESLGVPVLDSFISDSTWTSELAVGSFDTVTPFGKRQLMPHPLAKGIKVSNKLLRQASVDPEAVVREQLAYAVAHPEEQAFLTGNGAQQPLGVFIADANGISTAADTTAGSATVLAGDDFINTKHDLKPQYWASATWFMHRAILKNIRKLKDTAGNYIWQAGIAGPNLQVTQGTALASGNPGTIQDCPVLMSEMAPSTQTTGLYVAILGDFRYYWIADALDIQVQRLGELYAESNQTGFIVRKETDGMPVLEEAFRRLKMA